MHFVKTEELKTGMRLARPIYNKKSILLFDRNSLLSVQAIESIRNFGLIGVYVLEPAEPLPPMTQEDLEFERFQIKAVSAIEEELDRILKTRKQSRIQTIADMVIRNYGHLDEKINFYQNLRSLEDYVSRHSLNVAILCAMITHVMNIRREEQYHTVCAALLHDMGKLKKHEDVYFGAPYSREDAIRNCETQEEAYSVIEVHLRRRDPLYAGSASRRRESSWISSRKKEKKADIKCWRDPMYCWWRTAMMRLPR